ncbi:hypothetical protein BGY98DRAFT_940392 [Russula aff. rugulosa BPL654]|nr:hypothetical protein BGY98DRAFT_940392 [Russula aff. rugulosa BPL654]
MSDMRDTTNAFSSGLSVLLLGMSHKLCLLVSPTTACFPTDSLPNSHLGISANDTDAPPNARPLTNDEERAFLHPNPPTLTIRIPPRRLCTVCSRAVQVHVIIPNDYARVIGVLKNFRGQNYINAFRIVPVQNPHEIFFHIADIIALYVQRENYERH